MRTFISAVLFVTLFIACLTFAKQGFAEPVATIGQKSRCPVCGMFVAKYPGWVCQIHFDNEEKNFFDGVKDTMAFYFTPEKFGGSTSVHMTELWAKDYYSLKWIDMKKAFFVMGSDVYGPMGHELVPFSSNKAAISFQKDHHGKKVLKFEEITPELIDSLRSGHQMK